jgi:hypothetical protein
MARMLFLVQCQSDRKRVHVVTPINYLSVFDRNYGAKSVVIWSFTWGYTMNCVFQNNNPGSSGFVNYKTIRRFKLHAVSTKPLHVFFAAIDFLRKSWKTV